MKNYKTNQSQHRLRAGVTASVVILMLISAFVITGCESKKQSGTLAGAGIGALIGQAAGGDTKATVIGAAVGAGVGRLAGKSQDKKAAEEEEKAKMQATALTGSKWRIFSVTADNKPDFDSLTVTFRPDGKVVTSRYKSGQAMVFTEENYSILGDTLIINKADYTINATYRINGNDMFIDCQQFKAVLHRIQ